jgi:hypothetical protein
MYGMFSVMVAAAFWDNLACQLEMPVSTTHTTGACARRVVPRLRASQPRRACRRDAEAGCGAVSSPRAALKG